MKSGGRPNAADMLTPTVSGRGCRNRRALHRAGTVLLFAAALSLSCCSSRFESFPFLLADGTRVRMRESPGKHRDREGLLEPATGESATPLYRLDGPATVAGDGQAFAVFYSSSLEDCLLTVYSAEGAILTRSSLPQTGKLSFRMLIPIEAGNRIWGFRLSSESREGTFRMLAAGIEPRMRGFSIRDETVTLDGSVAVTKSSSDSMEILFTKTAREEMTGRRWLLRLELASESAPKTPLDPAERFAIRFTGTDASDSRTVLVRADPGWRLADLPEGAIGFIPRKARITRGETAPKDPAAPRAGLYAAAETPPLGRGSTPRAPLAHTTIHSFRRTPEGRTPPARSLLIWSLSDREPIPADPGTILEYGRSAWRRPDFEVFTWSRFPRVLIFDTADYGIQDGIFKRLAFFVEKAGYRGTIPDTGDIKEKHGYNAHDYRAEDLARFYSEALSRGIALTPGESELKRILLDNGIMTEGSAGFSPVDGAVLSISRESSMELRRLLLTHECFHGAFFESGAFRAECAKAWEALSDVERATWLLFFDYGAYDSGDRYLVVNEFQAYSLQQPREKVADFQDLAIMRLRKRFPDQGPLLERFLRDYPDSFTRSFDALDRALREAGGPPGGGAIAVQAGRP